MGEIMKYLKYFESTNNIIDIHNQYLRSPGIYLKYFHSENITTIIMYNNKFKYIPVLPNKLEILVAGNNILEKLPELPETLKELYVPKNNLLKLPKLPNNLFKLSCGENILEELPELPKSLLYLYCENNKLTELPFLPDSLIEVQVGKNNWNNPISYDLIQKFNIQISDLYTKEQKEKFGSYKYQKEFLTNTPEKYKDLEPIGFNDQIKEEFDWLFNAIDMELM
jgi:Leucine-rich repeat (LRR) protein